MKRNDTILVIAACACMLLVGGCGTKAPKKDNETEKPQVTATENGQASNPTGVGDETQDKNENYMIDLNVNEDTVLEHADGTTSVLHFTNEIQNPETEECRIALRCGEAEETFFSYARVMDAKAYWIDGVWYAQISIDYASADYETCLYRVEGTGFQKIQEMEALMEVANIEDGVFRVTKICQALGSYSSTKMFYINEAGEFVTDEQWYVVEVPDGGLYSFKNLLDLKVTENGVEKVLPANTSLQVVKIADDRVMLRLVDTKEEVELELQYEEGVGIMIDGTSEWEYFDSLPYAG